MLDNIDVASLLEGGAVLEGGVRLVAVNGIAFHATSDGKTETLPIAGVEVNDERLDIAVRTARRTVTITVGAADVLTVTNLRQEG